MLITELKAKETILSLTEGKVFLINNHIRIIRLSDEPGVRNVINQGNKLAHNCWNSHDS